MTSDIHSTDQSPAGAKRARRLLRLLLASPFLIAVLIAGPGALISRTTGLAPAASITLLLVILAAGLWITEAIPLFVTSFVLLFLEVAWLLPEMKEQGLAASSLTFLSPFFSNVILLFLGGFALSTAFRKYHIDRWLASRVLAQAAGRPRAVLLSVLLTTAILSMWMSNTATSAMMLGLSLPLLEQARADDPFRKGLPLAVAFGANLGGLGTPIGTPPNAIVIDALSRSGTTISFIEWMLMSLPFLALFLLAAYFVLVRIYPPTIEKLEQNESVLFELNEKNLIIMVTSATTVVLWLTSGLHALPTGTVALLPVIVFFGGRLLSRSDFQNLPWDVLMLAGGGLSLGAAVETSGLGQAIVDALPADTLGPFGLTLAIMSLAAVMTTFMSNTATANLLVPVAMGLSSIDSTQILVIVAYTCSCTMILPVSTPPNSMVFSAGGISTSNLARPALILTSLALLATSLGGPLWWGLMERWFGS